MKKSVKRFLRCWAVVLLLALLVVQLPAAAQAVSTDSAANPVPQAARGVIQICTFKPGVYDQCAIGTGFGIGKAGEDTDVFVTNWHVVTVDDGSMGEVYLMLDNADMWDRSTMVPCEILYTTEGYPDLAVIRTKQPVKGYKALPLIPSESVPVGSEVFALGYPGMVDDWNSGTNSGIRDITVTKGIISRFMEFNVAEKYGSKEAAKIIVHDALIEHGNSGGPLITSAGAVVGINTYGLGDQEGKSVNEYQAAVYIDYAMEALDSLGIAYDVYSASDGANGSVPAATAPVSGGSGNLAQILVIGGIILVAAGAVVAILLVSKGSKKGPSITGVSGIYAGKTLVVSAKGLTMGREGSCDVIFPNGTPGVSRLHCRISRSGSGLTITDLGSSYGTYVGGLRIQPNTPVSLPAGVSFYIGTPESAFKVNA